MFKTKRTKLLETQVDCLVEIVEGKRCPTKK